MQISIEYFDNGQWVENDITLNPDDDFSLSEETIDQDMCKLPRLIAYYSELSAESYAQAARHKQRAEAIEGGVAAEYRHSATEKITEGKVKESVASDPQVATAWQKYYKSEAQYRMLDGFYRALREKASLAIALCYKQKEEIRVMNSPIN